MNVSNFQIAQNRPSGTSAVTAISATQNLIEITAIYVANTTGSAVDYYIFHDDDGTTYSQDTALYYNVSVPANSTVKIASETLNGGIGLKPGSGGSIGIQTDTADALNFTFYGHTAAVATGR